MVQQDQRVVALWATSLADSSASVTEWENLTRALFTLVHIQSTDADPFAGDLKVTQPADDKVATLRTARTESCDKDLFPNSPGSQTINR